MTKPIIYHYLRYNNRRATGTIKELSEELGMKESKLRYLSKPIQKNRVLRNKASEHLEVAHDPRQKIYALYKGEALIADGTIPEIAQAAGMSQKDLSWYKTPSARKRNLSMALVSLEEEDE